jgi:hypothetical protein
VAPTLADVLDAGLLPTFDETLAFTEGLRRDG